MKKRIGLTLFFGALAAACSSNGTPSPGDSNAAAGSNTSAGSNASGGDDGGGGSSASGAGAGPAAGGNCFTLPVVDQVRLYPRSGHAAAMLGGKIVGSNQSPTDGFVDLVSITSAPAEDQWLELTLPSPVAYRFVKYYGPAANHGDVAEIEFLAGGEKVAGKAFAAAPADTSSAADAAFDGDFSTFYSGAVESDQYVGLDIGAGHVVATPVISPPGGTFGAATEVTLKSDTPGAVIKYTTTGGDPKMGTVYTGPFKVFGNATVKVIGTEDCMLDSARAESVFAIGSANPSAQSVFAIGNSLTGPIIAELPNIVSTQKKFSMDFHNCVTAGVDVSEFWAADPAPGCYDLGVNPLKPAAGATVADPKVGLADPTLLPPIDNLVVQPFAAQTCTPYSDGTHTGDGGYANNFYQLAKTKNNPGVRLWIHATWAAPTAQNWSMVDCFANGSTSTPPWPASGTKLPAVTDWESATKNHLAYHEAVRAEVDTKNGVDPSDPSTPGQHALIVPVGLALINLKHEVEAGKITGIASGDFFKTFFGSDGTDLHINNVGAYFDSLVFYACFYKTTPEGLPGDKGLNISDTQAVDMQRVAWQTVLDYKWSGLQ